jgi:DNA-directed RNA polymerase specialized sigma24 family protein
LARFGGTVLGLPGVVGNTGLFMLEREQDLAAEGGARRFETTHWSVVQRAGDSQSPGSAIALEKLCRAYWYPLYAFVRATGQGPEEARDLTQEFFARLLEKKWLSGADPQRGRFRNFLLTAMKHFLANEWHRTQAAKRGGGAEWIALDGLQAEQRYALEPHDKATPEAVFQRRWAATLIARGQERLRDEMIAVGEGGQFAILEPALAGERTVENYRAIANRFGVTESTVKSWVLRMRRRFRFLLLDEISQTLSEGQNPEEELPELLAALAS